ncbi:MAG TPA: DUF4062 domain-containing protein [Streptosporangiaceae bacterium]|nr:DUF4062 domain-containing protein [Streptosporangiaceae bacterium]
MSETGVIITPDQRLRVFVSSTLEELAAERQAVRDAVTRLRLVPVMFELGARPHPPREVYRAYLAQSQVFIGIYWQRYGWVAPGSISPGWKMNTCCPRDCHGCCMSRHRHRTASPGWRSCSSGSGTKAAFPINALPTPRTCGAWWRTTWRCC